jgi:nucleotide-binding universal stress UspA family protein
MVMRLQLKHIFCTTDFSDLSNRAIPYSFAMAKEFDARLYVCHVIGLPTSTGYGEVIADMVEQQNRAMEYAHEELIRIVGKQHTEWEPLVSTGHTADEIARLAEKKSADLVVTATHGRSGLKRLVLGSVTERLIRTLPCPMLIIPGTEQDLPVTKASDFKPRRILIGCDFSKVSTLAFEYGLSLAQEFQAELHLAHVVEPPDYRDLDRSGLEYGKDVSKDFLDYLNSKLEKLLPDDARNWCSPKTILLKGKPDEQLVDYADANDIDMITLGVRGQGLVEKLLIGSTTDRVIRRTSRPVLSVCLKVQQNSA